MPVIDYKDGIWLIHMPESFGTMAYSTLDEVQSFFGKYPFNKYEVTDEALNRLLIAAVAANTLGR